MKRGIRYTVISYLTIFVTILSYLQIEAIAVNNESVSETLSQTVPMKIQTPIASGDYILLNYKEKLSNLLDTNAQNVLSSMGVKYQKEQVTDVQIITDSFLNRTVTRLNLDNAQIDVDDKGEIVSYLNYEDQDTSGAMKKDYGTTKSALQADKVKYELNSAENLQDIICQIEEFLHLESYKLVECSNELHESIWSLIWNKDYGGGLLNHYDNVIVFVDAKDGSITSFGRKTALPNALKPIITEEQAIQIAQPVKERYVDAEITGVQLSFFRPNYFWDSQENIENSDDIHLVWKVVINDFSFVCIDAITGENLGGGESQSYARAIAPVTNLYRVSERVNRASSAFNRLGYTQPSDMKPFVGNVSKTEMLRTINYSGATGLYIACHGNYGLITDGTWTIQATSINHAYHFVFLDACKSSNQSGVRSWLNAFHIGGNGSGTAFVGWNIEVASGTAAAFHERFYRYVGYKSIYNAVISARQETINAGYSDCNPGFEGDTTYYGWKW